MHIQKPGASQGGFLDRFKIALGHPGLPQEPPCTLPRCSGGHPEVETGPTWLQSSPKSDHLGMKIFNFQSIKRNSTSAPRSTSTSYSHPHFSLWNDFNIIDVISF